MSLPRGIATAAGLFIVLAPLLYGQAPTNVGTASTGAVDRGEPYELGGKRLVFTTWEFVRPGGFAWIDETGKNVSVAGNQGPNEARFTRTETPRGIRIVAQPAVREGPIWSKQIPEDRSGGLVIINVIKDGDVYKAWGLDQGSERRKVYFESPDGRNWTQREVTFTVDGDTGKDMNFGEGTFFIDPSAPPAERYKFVTVVHMSFNDLEEFKRKHPTRWEPLAKREDVGAAFFVGGYVSPDGFAWKQISERLSVEHSDTQIVGCYDEQLRKYVIYTRKWMLGPRSTTTQASGAPFHVVGRRSIGRMESDTFSDFPVSELIVTPSPDMLPSDTIYTNCRTTIPGAPRSHVMFPTIWHQADDSTSVRMASSFDGKVWDFLPGGYLFDTPKFGNWDGGCVFARPNLIELSDGTFALPYTGYDVPHKYPRGRFKYATGYMTWPKGRLVALQADDLGEFSTVGFIAPGGRLLINANIIRAGSLQIEVANLQGQAVPGRSFADCTAMFGDLYRHPAAWKGQADIGVPAGTPVILRFRLDRAKLFALDFE